MNNESNKLVRLGESRELSVHRIREEGELFCSHDEQGFVQAHLMDYWRILVKRRWVALVALAAILVVTAIDTWNRTPIYRASMKLQIDSEQANFLPFKDANSSFFAWVPTEEFMKTQLQALTSQTLATRVIRRLRLDKDARFVPPDGPSRLDRVRVWLSGPLRALAARGQPPSPIPQKENPGPWISPLADTLVQGITLAPVPDSRVVVIDYESADPVLAAEILNALAAEYIQMNFEVRYEATATASAFLAEQLVDLKAKVEESEEELVRFGEQHDIYSLDDKENVTMQKLSDLNTALTAAQAERIEKESLWRVVRQTAPRRFPDVLRDTRIEAQEAKIAALRQELVRLRAVYKPGWPEVKQVAGQLEEAEKQLTKERDAVLQRAEGDYQAALQREGLLQEALESQKREAGVLSRSSIQYSILKREVDASKQLYEGLLQRMKEAGVVAGLKSNNIHVVDPAVPPRAPFKPDKTANMAKGLALGLLLGIALAFFLEYLDIYFDRSVKTPDQIERMFKIPSLGLIPSLQALAPGRKSQNHRLSLPRTRPAERSDHGALDAIELITHTNPQSGISEAYRNLRTSILLSSCPERAPRTLLVTSSQAGEGKTSTALNLAITLAQTGERVLLIDCDMRNPHIHSALGMENQNGLSTFLSGTSSGSHPIIRPCKIPNVFVFASGRIPPNPAELIVSGRMRRCLSLLDQGFDHIIIDSPPILSVTDARILATMVDGVVLVIQGGSTTREAIERTRRLLLDVRARILGTVLNNVNLVTLASYYYSKDYYGYGYGYGGRQRTAALSAEGAQAGSEAA